MMFELRARRGLRLKPADEEGGVEHLVPALQGLLARAIWLEQRREIGERLAQPLAQVTRRGIVIAFDDLSRRDRVRHHEVVSEPVADGLHGVTESRVLPRLVRAVTLGHELGDAAPWFSWCSCPGS